MVSEPLLVLGVAVIGSLVLAGLCLCYAVAADANARGAKGRLWGVFVLVLGPVAVPAYLNHRRDLPGRAETADRLERTAGSVGIGVGIAALVGGVVSPPDPFTIALYTAPLIVVSVPLAFACCYDPGWRALVPNRFAE
ncbi:hypothetical protein [Saliphagus infecundisoli]|uniref:Cardiolipin synthase N-terminal domain-containing protein n=1 Tax=Saliphagus infecundisoli TaxID=1849069 RepID=A0ABD5QK69_9EURY|nr:hypothetical protein [Saliphagus infecundisoli]